MAKSQCSKLSAFLAMDVLEKAQQLEAQGRHIIHLSVGQPDFPTPECIKEAAVKALKDNKTGYTPSQGIMPLREAIAEYYWEHYKVKVSPERIMVTGGSSPGIMALCCALFDHGDTVAMPTPSYACYENFINFAGATPQLIETKEEDGFQFDPDTLKDQLLPSTKAMLLNSPSNPVGSLISSPHMEKLASMGVTLISDEIYHGLVYEGETPTALQYSDDCCVCDGFSKRYSMTGWRLGWLVLPEDVFKLVNRVVQNFLVCPNSIAQWAGVAAIKEAWPETLRMREEYAKRRTFIIDGLRKLGFGVNSSPAGAFYVLADARHLKQDSLSLAFDILEKAGVGVTPGVDFGEAAEGYLRFSYSNSIENMEEALHRLKKYLENR